MGQNQSSSGDDYGYGYDTETYWDDQGAWVSGPSTTPQEFQAEQQRAAVAGSRPGLQKIAHLPIKNPLVALNLSQRLGQMNPVKRYSAAGATLDPRGLPQSVRNRPVTREAAFLKDPREMQIRQDNEDLQRQLGVESRLFSGQY